jgi:hypothetical protein
MHELQDVNVLQLSVRRHVSDRDHNFPDPLPGSRVLRCDFRSSGSIHFHQSGSSHLGPIPEQVYLSSLSADAVVQAEDQLQVDRLHAGQR